jgi:peroxiredoxin
MSKLKRMMLMVSILVSVLVVAGCSSDQSPAPDLQPGSPAPDFQLQSLDGEVFTLSSLSGGPVMLNFWATWCPPCRAEMPYIQETFEDEALREKGLVILAINVGEASSSIEEFMEGNGLSFLVLLDTKSSVAQEYNVRGIPTTLFIDKNGIIKYRKIGSFANKAEIDLTLLNSIIEAD